MYCVLFLYILMCQAYRLYKYFIYKVVGILNLLGADTNFKVISETVYLFWADTDIAFSCLIFPSLVAGVLWFCYALNFNSVHHIAVEILEAPANHFTVSGLLISWFSCGTFQCVYWIFFKWSSRWPVVYSLIFLWIWHAGVCICSSIFRRIYGEPE